MADRIDALKIEVATLRTIISELQSDYLETKEFVYQAPYRRAVERAARSECVTEGNYRLICDLVCRLPSWRTSQAIRYIEGIYAGTRQPPAGTGELVAAIRQAYGHGGPSGPTIRRALGKFSKFSSY
jgi:hypothetical protein